MPVFGLLQGHPLLFWEVGAVVEGVDPTPSPSLLHLPSDLLVHGFDVILSVITPGNPGLVEDHDYQVILGKFLQRPEYVVKGYLIGGAAVRAVDVEGAVPL